MVLVFQIYIVMQPAARENPTEAAGRSSILRRHTARPPKLYTHYHHEEEEEEKEEEKRHARRGLKYSPNMTLPLTEHTITLECPAVDHQSNSRADDPSQPAVLVGTAEVWATLQLAKSRKYCEAKGPCCHVSTL